MSTQTSTTKATAGLQIDPRGPRFGAAITCVVLALAIVLGPAVGVWLVVLQALAFGAGAILGVQYQPYGMFFKAVIRPRLAPPAHTEDSRPPRFAQLVGLVFALVAIVGVLIGAAPVFYIAAGMALAAAFLNAVFDFCLGCEMYLLIQRVRGAATA